MKRLAVTILLQRKKVSSICLFGQWFRLDAGNLNRDAKASFQFSIFNFNFSIFFSILNFI